MTEPVILADVVRSGFVEGHHRGSVVVTSPDGSVEWSAGIVDEPMFPRSSNKPMQALGMLRNGLPLTNELLALAAASHSGEQFHLDGVREILAGVGLDETALRTPASYPLDDQSRDEWIRAGHAQERITMNCSGKHAAMIATCVQNGWPIHDPAREKSPDGVWGRDDYRSPEHPLQQAIRLAIEDTAGEKVAHVAVDGCGAPLVAISLAGLARSFGLFAAAPPETFEGRIATAFRQYPEYASGSRRDEAALMRAVPGLFCKIGAEGVYAAGLADGRGIAVKIEDGATRASSVAIAATLRRFGLDHEAIDKQVCFPLYGGSVEVGAVRPNPAVFG
ncbi:L-asparaginase II [Kribbella aluminosa]|uniref:L-asparaginase II n=1 Tax=Kribbella aluminosa TaxID=416017 RepID=A0ABS4UT47_9ACTN|nr:asparaginase [Kribbella aluminosa]MBP2354798.1 L-asparaginase II [Kribbella aluminosa]